jgi:hypothetical protein
LWQYITKLTSGALLYSKVIKLGKGAQMASIVGLLTRQPRTKTIT